MSTEVEFFHSHGAWGGRLRIKPSGLGTAPNGSEIHELLVSDDHGETWQFRCQLSEETAAKLDAALRDFLGTEKVVFQ